MDLPANFLFNSLSSTPPSSFKEKRTPLNSPTKPERCAVRLPLFRRVSARRGAPTAAAGFPAGCGGATGSPLALPGGAPAPSRCLARPRSPRSSRGAERCGALWTASSLRLPRGSERLVWRCHLPAFHRAGGLRAAAGRGTGGRLRLGAREALMSDQSAAFFIMS